MSTALIALDPLVGLTTLGESVILGWFVLTTVATTTGLSTGSSSSLATLLACFDGVNLALGKLSSTDTLVWLAVLTETGVLYMMLVVTLQSYWDRRSYRWAYSQTF